MVLVRQDSHVTSWKMKGSFTVRLSTSTEETRLNDIELVIALPF